MPGRADTYRPHTTPGGGARAGQRTLGTRLQRDKDLGSRDSRQRSVEQTEIGRFRDYSLPAVYHGVVRSVALQPGRDLMANARLFATVAQAMADALIAVFDAKYHCHLWRPVTAIRNGNIEGHDSAQRDASWTPLIDTPLHPEYPCAHCTLASTVAAVLDAESARHPLPALSTSSPTAQNARLVAGVRYRFSTEAGLALGQRIGESAVEAGRAAEQ